MDDNPTRMIETDQSSCPIDAPEKSCRADSGAYIVHPARAAPSGTNRLDSITSPRSEEHTSELQSRLHLVCRLLLEKKKKKLQRHETAQHTYSSAYCHACVT